MLTKADLYGNDAKKSEPDPLPKLTVPVWVCKGSIVSDIHYKSPYFKLGSIAYAGCVYYVFLKQLRAAVSN